MQCHSWLIKYCLSMEYTKTVSDTSFFTHSFDPVHFSPSKILSSFFLAPFLDVFDNVRMLKVAAMCLSHTCILYIKIMVCHFFVWFNDIFSIEWFAARQLSYTYAHTYIAILEAIYYWYIREEILKLAHMYFGDICLHTSGYEKK